jgi:2-polyprenyl-6-methoxyphenol hydroxylase-like FAD-dependent oxidoreductase
MLSGDGHAPSGRVQQEGAGCSVEMAPFVETTPFLLGADGVNTAVRDAMSRAPKTKTKVRPVSLPRRLPHPPLR